MLRNIKLKYIKDLINNNAQDIINSSGMQLEKNFPHHGVISCYEHSFSVAKCSIIISKLLHLKVETRSLIRGALLHDYFLYDWHISDKSHKLHAFTHAKRALLNASNDFALNSIEKDIIKKHMFPLNIRPPRYKESIIVCIADKFCASYEFIAYSIFKSLKAKEHKRFL